MGIGDRSFCEKCIVRLRGSDTSCCPNSAAGGPEYPGYTLNASECTAAYVECLKYTAPAPSTAHTYTGNTVKQHCCFVSFEKENICLPAPYLKESIKNPKLDVVQLCEILMVRLSHERILHLTYTRHQVVTKWSSSSSSLCNDFENILAYQCSKSIYIGINAYDTDTGQTNNKGR